MEDYVRGYKYRIYPTKEQEAKFNQMFGNARVVFNYFLDVRQKAWKEERRSVANRYKKRRKTLFFNITFRRTNSFCDIIN